ncbi:hypothetical protein H6G91_31750 [Nostoc muscorum FACHB-395]|jgi:hypothetical protein|nr:hypothetical protein [Desmonostoc muscorum FACHB-395]
MKVKLLLKYIVYSFNVLLLSSTFQVVRADQNNKCFSVNNGGVCVNNGSINNRTTINHIYNYPINRHTESVSPTSVSPINPSLVIGKPVHRKIFVSTEEPPSEQNLQNHPSLKVKE